MANTTEMSAEELEKQRQMQQQYQAEMIKQQKIQYTVWIIQQSNPIEVLKTLSTSCGVSLSCPNPQTAYGLLTTIYNDLFGQGEVSDEVIKQIATALNMAVHHTTQRRMFGVGGMGMNQFGMNPMMGMGMPGMGMNQFGMGMNQQQQTGNSDDNNIAVMKQFIESQLKPMNMYNAVDPLIFLQLLLNNGIDIDLSSDQQFSQLCTFAIVSAVYGMDQYQFQTVSCILQYMYMSNYQQQMAENAKKNGGQAQNNMMGMMNPMMMGMGMPGMMGGMNPMMGMGMPGMGMMGMPGMNNSFGVQQNTGAIW